MSKNGVVENVVLPFAFIATWFMGFSSAMGLIFNSAGSILEDVGVVQDSRANWEDAGKYGLFFILNGIVHQIARNEINKLNSKD